MVHDFIMWLAHGLPLGYVILGFNFSSGAAFPEGTNQAISNYATQEQLRNNLIPQYASGFSKILGTLSPFYQQWMQQGSPYYQQQQRSSFENTARQLANATAMAHQQQRSQGLPFAPTGGMAGLLGGQAAAGAQSLSTNYLQNLFNNAQLMQQAAGGLSGTLSQTNPASLFQGNQSVPSGQGWGLGVG